MPHPAIIIGTIVVVLAIVGIIYVAMQPAAGGTPTGGSTGDASTGGFPTPRAISVCDDNINGYAFSCPSGKINVTSAKYGRFSDTQCMHPNAASNALCSGADVTGVLGAKCNGQANCSTTADMFGDPCPFILKQLVGTYTCQ